MRLSLAGRAGLLSRLLNKGAGSQVGLDHTDIPSSDFVSPQFDSPTAYEPSEGLIIFSTPRSGSTLLCDLLAGAHDVVAHEYFQPHHYRPILEDRWGVPKEDDAAYVDALLRNRTAHSGLYAFNVHGEHLPAFQRALPHLPDAPLTYLFLRRRDTFRQAISLMGALTSGAWSSEFSHRSRPSFDRRILEQSISNIVLQNFAIETFLKQSGKGYTTLFYEDLLAEETPRIPLSSRQLPLDRKVQRTHLRKQSNQYSARLESAAYQDFLKKHQG